jgi:hypothetical protein
MENILTASVLGPSGSKFVCLDTSRAWMHRTIGEFVCSFQWLDLDDGEDPQPCMCIFKASRMMDVVPYVIPQRNAYAFADKSGGPSPHAIGAAFKACLHMGTFPSNDTVRKLLDIIVEGIPDLVRMPTDQHEALNLRRTFYGMEATAKINGRTVREEVL